jgi:hypothetical protein
VGGTPRWPGNQRSADGAPPSASRDTLPDPETGSLVINIKNRVPRWGELKGQWHTRMCTSWCSRCSRCAGGAFLS